MTVDLHEYAVRFVDDDADVVATMRYAIGTRFNLLTASSGAAALGILAEQDVAVLLTDQRMPGMTGVELCARALQHLPDLVTMIITAYADIKTVIDAINHGHVSAYLPKPWTDGQLVEALKVSIERVRATRLERELGVEMVRTAPAHVMPAVRRLLACEVLELVSEGEDHARKTIELFQGLGPLPDDAEARRLRAVGHQRASLAALERVTEIATLNLAEIELPVAASCDVASVVEGVVLIMRPEVERVAELHMVIGAAPSVIMDRAALGRVLVTLLSSAIDSMQDQPGGRIRVEVGTDTGAAVVRVSAEGCEAAEERMESAARAPSEVGLSVACELVERAGGTTTTTREPGCGVSIEVRLPIDSPDGVQSSVFTWGPFRVDLISNRVQVDAREVLGLQPLQVRLLAHFVQNVGRVSSHQELLKTVFGFASPMRTKRLTRTFSELRRRIGLDAGKHLVSVRGGYGIGIDPSDQSLPRRG